MANENVQTDKGELRQFISFSIGEEEYGLELLRVKEVIRVRETTWLPRAPSFVKGIINLRGDVIPIIDLRDKFGLTPRCSRASPGSSSPEWASSTTGSWSC